MDTDWQKIFRATAAFIVIALGMIVTSLDTMVNQAFPSIVSTFDIAPASIKWIPLAYLPFSCFVILVFGGWGDRFGYREIFRLGVCGAAIALFLCWAAPSWPLLLAARALQGVSAGIVMSCAIALAVRVLPDDQKSRQAAIAIRVLSFFGFSAAGPILGAVCITYLDWPSVFLLRAIVLGALGVLLWVLPTLLPEGKGQSDGSDPVGAILLTLGLVALLSLVVVLFESGMPYRLWLAALCILICVLLVRAYGAHARRVQNPFVPLDVFQSRDVGSLNLLSVATNLFTFAPILWVPFFVGPQKLHWLIEALLVAASPIGIAVAAGTLAVRPAWAGGPARKSVLQKRGVLVAIMSGAGVAATLMLEPTPLFVFGILLFTQGVGTGLFTATYQDVIAARFSKVQGIGGSLAELTRTLGLSVGAACLSPWLPLRGTPPETFRPAFLATVACATLGLAIVWTFRIVSEEKPQPD